MEAVDGKRLSYRFSKLTIGRDNPDTLKYLPGDEITLDIIGNDPTIYKIIEIDKGGYYILKDMGAQSLSSWGSTEHFRLHSRTSSGPTSVKIDNICDFLSVANAEIIQNSERMDALANMIEKLGEKTTNIGQATLDVESVPNIMVEAFKKAIYYDLVKVNYMSDTSSPRDSIYIPAPLFLKTPRRFKLLMSMARSSEKRDENTFRCYNCNSNSFYSGLCNFCYRNIELEENIAKRQNERMVVIDQLKNDFLLAVDNTGGLLNNVKYVSYLVATKNKL